MTLFGTTPSPSTRLSGKWLIDTGCSNHVTGDLSLLTHVYGVLSCPIGLPNGQQVCAIHEGSAHLTHHMTLQRVLYVPSLTCNLIFVSQLSDDL